MNSENLILRELFGGAILLAIPERFLDISDFRPVPDNQEVFADAIHDQSLIVEVLECVGVPDEAAAQFHFEEQARMNESPQFIVNSIAQVHPAQVPQLELDQVHASSVWLLAGQQLAPKGRQGALNKVSIIMFLARLNNYKADLLISLNTPVYISEGSSAAETAGAGHQSAYLSAPELLTTVIATLKIVDWGLFG